MSDPISRAAQDVCLGDDPHVLATVTTANGQLIALPDAMIGKFCVFAAETLDVWIRFGTSNGVQVDRTSTAADAVDGSGVLTPNAKAPHLYIPAGQERQLRLQGAWTHFAHISSGTTGLLRFDVAQGHFGND